MKGAKRKFLFIHQNFPGQFVHLAVALAREGHEVVALGVEGREVAGVSFYRYKVPAPKTRTAVPLAKEYETKIIRGSACADGMLQLAKKGFEPDLIVAHPGWGEALFCKDVWPDVKLLMFSEFFFHAEGGDYDFDKEFGEDTPALRSRLRLKNTALLHALHDCDAAYAPTQWQYSRVPPEFKSKTSVIFDGIDTQLVKPDAAATFTIPGTEVTVAAGDEVLTFVNRNMEPYRGFHTFMRALPEILKQRPKARCVVVGRDDVSYGQKPKNGKSWREVMLKEVGDKLPLDRVHFVGALPYAEYLKVLQVSRCHVYLTYPFVLGWSCVEALSAGCTVVGSDTEPVREVIRDGETGLLTDFFDAKALAKRAVAVLASPEKYKHLGTAARETIVAKYDLESRCLPAQLALVKSLSR